MDHRANAFQCDDPIAFQLARVAFKDSPGECHFIPQKGKRWPQGILSHKGQFVGIHTACQGCNQAHEIILKMHDQGKSHQWNWDKHCAKFHQQVSII